MLLSRDTPSKCIHRTSRDMCLTEWDIYNTATAVTMNHSLINAHFGLFFLLVTSRYWTICFITCLYKAHQNDLKKQVLPSILFTYPVYLIATYLSTNKLILMFIHLYSNNSWFRSVFSSPSGQAVYF